MSKVYYKCITIFVKDFDRERSAGHQYIVSPAHRHAPVHFGTLLSITVGMDG